MPQPYENEEKTADMDIYADTLKAVTDRNLFIKIADACGITHNL